MVSWDSSCCFLITTSVFGWLSVYYKGTKSDFSTSGGWYIKRLVHPKMKISLCFTHAQGILGVYDFILSDEFRVLLKIVLALPSFIMAVGRCFFIFFNSPKVVK